MSHFLSTSAMDLVTFQSPPHKPAATHSPHEYSKGVCTYSTPHAPRFGSQSALKFKKSYMYLNNKSWSTADLDKQRIKAERSSHSVSKVQERDEEVAIVQPFRRTVSVAPPQCVPLLDLRRFNERDEDMRPIELIKFPQPLEMSTDRTDISWGTSRLSPKLVISQSTEPSPEPPTSNDNETCVEESEQKDPISEHTEEENIAKPQIQQNEAHLKYVENRVVSEERGREEHCHPTQHQPPAKSKSSALPGMLNEKALTKRIRFSARVLTQNGRDIHRELCGFFFLADNSLTIYEFRQFGQRVSALPFVPRGVYRHPIGRRVGEIYEIRHIKRGATLYFSSSSLTSLPEGLKKRSVIGIRVSDIDAEEKLKIMRMDLHPDQYFRVNSYLCQSPSDESKRHSVQLQTLQGMLRNRLKGRASQVLVGLGRYLRQQGGGDGIVDKILLQQGMRAYHISLTPEDFDQLWDLLQDEFSFDLANNRSGSNEGVWLERIIAGLIGDISEERKSFVRKVFLKMDSSKSGSVSMNEMQKYFSPLAHPDVLAKKTTVEELMHSLFSCLQPPNRELKGYITYADFEHYYDGLSIEISSDSKFINIMTTCWSI